MQKLTVKLGENIIKEHIIDQEVVTVGRARDNEIIIENLSVSRNHCRLRKEGDTFVLVDLNSANGTFVNGVRISKTELVDGDIISVGKHRLHFENRPSVADQPLVDVDATATPTDPRPLSAAIAAATRGGQPLPETPKPAAEDEEAIAIAAAVESHALVPALVVTQGKQEGQLFLLKGNETTIGRHATDIRLHDWNVGKRHAVVVYDKGVFTVRDLGSWQGTILDGEKVKTARLRDGSELVFGGTHLMFRLATPEDIAAMTPKASDTADFIQEEQLPSSAELQLPDTGEPRELGEEGETGQHAPLEDDDEFAPMTDEELAALEEEVDSMLSQPDELARQAEWEQLEAEKLLEEGGGIDIRRPGQLIEKESRLRQEEEAFIKAPDPHEMLDDPHFSGGLSVEQEDEEEHVGLFGGDLPDSESALDASGPQRTAVEAPPAASQPRAAQSAVATSPSEDEIPVPEGVDPKEVRRWSRGLKNRSRIVRREAARKLKELTGLDYDWESDPE